MQRRLHKNKSGFTRIIPKKFLVLVTIAILIFLVRTIFPSNQITRKAEGALAPLPTAINQNFLNQVERCFIPVAAVYGFHLRITQGFRSMAEQEAVYDLGRTTNGHIVTEAAPGHSLHNYGYAVDVADEQRGYKIDWTKLVKIASYCSLESGGIGDLPHFEERAGLTTDQFAMGMRPPLLTLPCATMETRFASGEKLTLRDLKKCGAPNF